MQRQQRVDTRSGGVDGGLLEEQPGAAHAMEFAVSVSQRWQYAGGKGKRRTRRVYLQPYRRGQGQGPCLHECRRILARTVEGTHRSWLEHLEGMDIENDTGATWRGLEQRSVALRDTPRRD